MKRNWRHSGAEEEICCLCFFVFFSVLNTKNNRLESLFFRQAVAGCIVLLARFIIMITNGDSRRCLRRLIYQMFYNQMGTRRPASYYCVTHSRGWRRKGKERENEDRPSHLMAFNRERTRGKERLVRSLIPLVRRKASFYHLLQAPQ